MIIGSGKMDKHETKQNEKWNNLHLRKKWNSYFIAVFLG